MKTPRTLLYAATISLILMNASTIAGPPSNPPGQSDRIQQVFSDLLPNAQGGDVKSMRILGNMLFECLYKDLDPSDPEPDYCVGLTLDDRRTAYRFAYSLAIDDDNGVALDRLAGHLTDDQIAAAETAGQDIFDRCCADAIHLNDQ